MSANPLYGYRIFQSDDVKKTTSATVTTASVVILPANPLRKALYIWNNSANSAYITFGPTSSSATPTYIHATFTTLAFNGPVIYTGAISAIRNAGTGNFTCYEIQ